MNNLKLKPLAKRLYNGKVQVFIGGSSPQIDVDVAKQLIAELQAAVAIEVEQIRTYNGLCYAPVGSPFVTASS